MIKTEFPHIFKILVKRATKKFIKNEIDLKKCIDIVSNVEKLPGLKIRDQINEKLNFNPLNSIEEFKDFLDDSEWKNNFERLLQSENSSEIKLDPNVQKLEEFIKMRMDESEVKESYSLYKRYRGIFNRCNILESLVKSQK